MALFGLPRYDRLERYPELMEEIRVLIANHHPIVRTELRILLERNSNVRVIGEAANGREAIVLAEFQHPDIAVLDVNLHLVRGIDVSRAIAVRAPGTKTLFVSDMPDQGCVMEVFHAGGHGYVLGDSAHVDLPRAITVVAGGAMYLSPAACFALVDEWNRAGVSARPLISERKKQLLSLAMEGQGAAEIARVLMISKDQVQSEWEDLAVPLARLGISPAVTFAQAGCRNR